MNESSPRGDPAVFARRASSFGAHAAEYAAQRPDYPDAAVRWALEPVAGRAPLRILDLAAGTGKLTAGLVRHSGDVVAVEPNAGMRAEFARHLPGVRVLAGTAEDIPLPDGSVDAVLAGQAFHWFDHGRALPEIRRVLALGGVLAGLWNVEDDRVPWVRRMDEISGSVRSVRRWRPETELSAASGTLAFERAEFPHTQRRTARSLTATVGTHSHMLIMPEAERAAVLARVLDYLRTAPETAAGEFDLPLVTIAVRAVTDPGPRSSR